jgi:hypothetical protein
LLEAVAEAAHLVVVVVPEVCSQDLEQHLHLVQQLLLELVALVVVVMVMVTKVTTHNLVLYLLPKVAV